MKQVWIVVYTHNDKYSACSPETQGSCLIFLQYCEVFLKDAWFVCCSDCKGICANIVSLPDEIDSESDSESNVDYSSCKMLKLWNIIT